MESLQIEGGKRLSGTVYVSGSKNASLPILAATLLVGEPCTVHSVPVLSDTTLMCNLLSLLGCSVVREGGKVTLSVKDSTPFEAPYELVSRMRASICVLGPLLAARGRAKVALPGGCAIGNRPVDLHLKGLAALGAEIEIKQGYIEARSKRLKGARMELEGAFGSSVLATANVMMAATLAEGTTVICSAAREPEIQDLAIFLNSCGAKISGAGTSTIEIEGVRRLHSSSYRVIPDRIEAGTFLLAGALTNSKITVKGALLHHLSSLIEKMEISGIAFEKEPDTLTVLPRSVPIKPVTITTAPYPGFPTDLQAQMMAFLSLADGVSIITEGGFPERFAHIAELNRMGANITKQGASAKVTGVKKLCGAPVSATDLRASAALVLAALASEGVTTISNIEHIDRGYERIEEKFNSLGASIKRIGAATSYETLQKRLTDVA
ncbi:MAG: UDP-N-acetylglucosamine 1-carboxyvinyltransferase [Planctomycetota bacterium]|nr:UDP-N-acetylglucosamine 1-carboxyvinyltransferase [Planctomycetota bacterium]